MARREFIECLAKMASAVRKVAADKSRPRGSYLDFSEEMISDVERLLRGIPALKDLENYKLQRISGGGGISFRRAAISVLELLSLGGDPKAIHNDLIDFVGRKRIPNFYLAGINGISLSKRVQISKNISLVAENDIAPSWAREFIFRKDRLGRIIGPSHEPPPPRAALMISNKQPVFIPKGEDFPKGSTLGMDAVDKVEEETLFCLTLASNSAAPVFNAKTSWIDHPAYSYHGLTGGSGGSSPGQQSSLRYDDFDEGLVISLFNDIQKTKGQDRELLFLAVDRLRRSRLHQDPVNRAVDLGIALEVLFLQGQENQELSYRAALRGAFFVGKDKKGRSETYDIVRQAYGARSSAVHKGKLTKWKQIEALPKADNVCRAAAIEVVSCGGFPKDWEALIIEK